MIARKLESVYNIQAAIDTINRERFDGNIRLKRFDIKSNTVHFTLTVNSSREPGSRMNAINGRRIAAACWHVHGYLFDALFQLAPNAIVTAGKKRITANDGNWEDWQIGSQAFPVMYSESCDCNYGRD